MIAIIVAILVMLGILIICGLLAERVEALMRRRFADSTLDGNLLLLWGMLVLASFLFGLVVMYVLR